MFFFFLRGGFIYGVLQANKRKEERKKRNRNGNGKEGKGSSSFDRVRIALEFIVFIIPITNRTGDKLYKP